MFISDLNDGDIAEIVKLPEGEGAEKLTSLGINVGTEIEKISGSPLGSLYTIGVSERFFALTSDIAEKTEVKLK